MSPPTHPYRPLQQTWRASLLCVALLLCGLLWGCPNKATSKHKGPPRAKLYQINAPRSDGTTFSFRSLYGKVALVDFFATSCARCEVQQIPLLKKLYTLHNKDGLAVVGVAIQPQAKQFLRPFLQVLKLPYPVVIGDKQFLTGRTVFGFVRSIPRSYLIDRCGKIRRFYSGVVKPKDLTLHIQTLLKEKQRCP